MSKKRPRLPTTISPTYAKLALAARDKTKMTQRSFAYLLGVHEITVSKWERSKLKPNEWQIEVLQAIRKAPLKRAATSGTARRFPG